MKQRSKMRIFFWILASANPWSRARDLCALGLLVQLGLRVHELVGLNVGQVDITAATLRAVVGKRGAVHDLPLVGPVVLLLAAWLPLRADTVAPAEMGLFVSRAGQRLSTRAVQRFIVGLRDGLPTHRKVTPHTLRHTAATSCLLAGIDL